MADTDPIKYIDIHEFWELGFIQEINRLLLHPAGLALEVSDVDQDDRYDTLRVWDYREDPEGIIFGDDMIDLEKVANIKSLQADHLDARTKLFGGLIQQPDIE